MRIIATSDLHYNIARSRGPTEAVAAEICRAGGDTLILVGDTASTDLGVLERALGLFDSFKGLRLAVAGNHELWAEPGGDSLARYENALREACSRNGFWYLDAAPLTRDGYGFVGSVGWYDYSFRSTRLGIPLRFYQSKVAPGWAARSEPHRHLLEPGDDIPPAAHQVTTRWMDGARVRLPFGDVDFTHRLSRTLRAHLEQVRFHADRIVAAVHHLPFAELVPRSVIPNWEFATAFLGSELLGEALLDYDCVKYVVCGHSHNQRTCRKHHLTCTSIGSTYREKRYVCIDV